MTGMDGLRLCHVTAPENVPSILERGLLPMAGGRAAQVGDGEPRVCLCEERHARAWAAVLDAGGVLRVDMSGLPAPERFDYSTMPEYLYPDPIPPERISVCEPPEDPAISARLCENYVLSVSELAVALFRELERSRPETGHAMGIVRSLETISGILPRLPWHHADPEGIVAALREYGEEGEYTMCDTFAPAGRKFWELLERNGYLELPFGKALADQLLLRLGGPFRELRTGGCDE